MSQNLLTFSEQLDNAVWGLANGTITANTAADPFTGAMTADTFSDASVSTVQFRLQYPTPTPALASGVLYTFSCVAKATSSGRWLSLQIASTVAVWFDLTGGVVGTVTGTGVYAAITPIPGAAGWYQCSFVFRAFSADNRLQFFTAPSDAVTSYTGDGTHQYFVTRVQLNAGASPGPYQLTTSTAVSSGFRAIIPDATNLAIWSEDFSNAAWAKGTGVTATANTSDVTDPLGGNTASKVVYDGSGAAGSFFVVQNITGQLLEGPGGISVQGAVWARLASGSAVLRCSTNQNPAIATGQTVGTAWVQLSDPGLSPFGSFSNLQVAVYRDIGDNTARTIYLWGAQSAKASWLPRYVKTTTQQVNALAPIRNIDPDATNIALQSENFAVSPWINGTGVTTTANTTDVTDPLGGNTASKVVYDGTASANTPILLQFNGAIPIANASPISVAMWVRTTSGSVDLGIFNNYVIQTVTVTAAWTLMSFPGFITTSSATFAMRLYHGSDTAARTLYVWGAQATRATRLGPYVKTTTATVNASPAIRNIAPDATNLILQSEDFSNASWTKGTGVTATANTTDVTDPLGGNTASKLVYDGSGAAGSFYVIQFMYAASEVGQPVAGAMWVKLSSGSAILRLANNGSSPLFTSTTVGTTWIQVQNLGTTATGTSNMQLDLARDAADNTARTLYVWGAQFNRANRLGPYVKTTTSVVGASPSIRNNVSRQITSLSQISGLVALHDVNLGITQSSGVVSNWVDQSGQANTLTATGTGKPTFNAADLNGLPTLTFDGVDDFMSYATINKHAHVFLVVKVLASATKCIFAQSGADGTNGFTLGMIPTKFFLTNTTNSDATNGTASISNAIDTTTWHIFSINGNALVGPNIVNILRKDGVDIGTTVSGSGGFSLQAASGVIGYNGGAGTAFANFKLAYCAIYNRGLGSGEVTMVEQLLGRQFNLPVTTIG